MQNNYLKTFNSKKEFMDYLAQQKEEEVDLDADPEPTEKDLEELEAQEDEGE